MKRRTFCDTSAAAGRPPSRQARHVMVEGFPAHKSTHYKKSQFLSQLSSFLLQLTSPNSHLQVSTASIQFVGKHQWALIVAIAFTGIYSVHSPCRQLRCCRACCSRAAALAGYGRRSHQVDIITNHSALLAIVQDESQVEKEARQAPQAQEEKDEGEIVSSTARPLIKTIANSYLQ